MIVPNWSLFFNRSTTVNLIKGGFAPSLEYMCYYTDLWTGEKVGSSRGNLHLDDIVPHGHMALRVECHRVLATEDEP